ncbi:hydroxyproline-rich glycoprotein family protein [Senna tora]|uniref:Hydroxyproline-rich glycoprotein family protein n=1 Tax=Senna tora TaxID=362788 RepID=A0A834TZ34_9FABA|nr:hydroxyproline-rich glycoprotein family protein [Senna tora]
MELEDTSSSRVSIGFPVGLALLFALFFFVCLFFCCCLHWDKLQSLLPSYGLLNLNNTHTNIQPHLTSSNNHKPPLPLLMMKQKEVQSLPVLMPGDDVPKFIAMECPCQPPKVHQTITIQVDKAA